MYTLISNQLEEETLNLYSTSLSTSIDNSNPINCFKLSKVAVVPPIKLTSIGGQQGIIVVSSLSNSLSSSLVNSLDNSLDNSLFLSLSLSNSLSLSK
jgi:hypothetical protein